MVKEEIENLIFFDVETTGLFEEDTQENPVKIAQLSMVSVKTSHFLQSNGELGTLPRLIGILSLTFNPVSRFTEKATKIHGLTNDMLSTHALFSTMTNRLIKSTWDMLEIEPDPQLNRTCLIGHDENGFGFHLLKRELNDPTVTRNISCFNTFEYSQLAFKCCAKPLELTYEEKFGTRPTNTINRAEADAKNLFKIARMTPGDFVRTMQSFKRQLNDM